MFVLLKPQIAHDIIVLQTYIKGTGPKTKMVFLSSSVALYLVETDQKRNVVNFNSDVRSC